MDYHQPSDEVKPDWDLSGAAEDAQLLFVVGYRVANADRMPEWKPGNEFRAKREEMLEGAVQDDVKRRRHFKSSSFGSSRYVYPCRPSS